VIEGPENLLIKQLHFLKQLRQNKLIEDEVIISIQKKLVLDCMPLLRVEKDMENHLQKEKIHCLFVCYAHQDNESPNPSNRWLNRLLVHLQPLSFQCQIKAWSDKDIEIGNDWHQSIQLALKDAKAAILLISPDFLASKYIRNSELPILLKNAKDRGVNILPIILRHCLYKETKFKYPDPVHGPEELSLSSLQAANSPSKPLNGMEEYEQDETLVKVAKRLLEIVQQN
jgi:hypothetical protein